MDTAVRGGRCSHTPEFAPAGTLTDVDPERYQSVA
jgi:hypothetical protein